MKMTFNLSSLAVELGKLPGIRVDYCGDGPEDLDVDPLLDLGSWAIILKIARSDDGRISEDGWLCLEFLTWLINHDMRERPVILRMDSLPPYLNHPGDTIEFILVGSNGYDPDELARWIAEVREKIGFFRDDVEGSYYDFTVN